MELPNSICWGECHEKGGQCRACQTHDSDALAGYCCSGVNHHGGGGPVSNGDCPANAVAAVTQSTHACVVLKEKTPEVGSNHLNSGTCAILYDGPNQTGTFAHLSEGEMWCCDGPLMPLNDASESVYVTPATGSISIISNQIIMILDYYIS